MANYKKSLPNDSGSLIAYETAVNYQAMRPGKVTVHVGVPAAAGADLTYDMGAGDAVTDLPLLTVTEPGGVYIEEVQLMTTEDAYQNGTNYNTYTIGYRASGDAATTVMASGSTYGSVTTGSIATISFVAGSGSTRDTILDSGSGFVAAGITAGMQIYVGTTSTTNDGAYELYSVAAGVLTLDSVGAVTTESAGGLGAGATTILGSNGFGSHVAFVPRGFSVRDSGIHIEDTGPPLEQRLTVPYFLPQNYTLLFSKVAAAGGLATTNLTIVVHYRIKNDDLNVSNAGVAGSAHSESLVAMS